MLECLSSQHSGRYNLKWFKNGQPLTMTSRHHFVADDQLLVVTATQLTDAGEYTCVMTNTLGSERSTLRLSVVERDREANALYVLDGGDTSREETTRIGIIVIAVFVCIVGTSLVWVIVIYRMRRRGRKEYYEDGKMPESMPTRFNLNENCVMQTSPLLWAPIST